MTSYFDHGYYFLLTSDLSLYVTDANGHIINHLYNTSFSNNSVTNHFIHSPYGQVWLIQDHSIHIIDFPSCFHEISPPLNQGDIEDIAMVMDTLYIATSKGLYFYDGIYKLLLQEPVTKLLSWKEDLFACYGKSDFKSQGKAKRRNFPCLLPGRFCKILRPGNLLLPQTVVLWYRS